MIFRKNFVRALVLLAFVCGIGTASAMARDWPGTYTHDEESIEPDGSRISYWFRLEVIDTGGELTAILSNGTNGKVTRRAQMKVAAGKIRAEFYYDHCLPLAKGQKAPCSDEFKPGEQMFALEEIPVHCQTELITVWQKLNLAQQTESGDEPERVFFRSIFEA